MFPSNPGAYVWGFSQLGPPIWGWGGFLVSPVGWGVRSQVWVCPGATFTKMAKRRLRTTDIHACFWGEQGQASQTLLR